MTGEPPTSGAVSGGVVPRGRTLVVRTGVRLLWLGLVPGLMAAWLVRLATTAAQRGGASGLMMAPVSEHWIVFAVGVFVLLSVLLRYWRRHLPGGRFLADERPAAPGRRRPSPLPLAFGVALAAAAALFLRTSVAQPYRVTSSSMLPGLEPGDVVLADKRAYGFRLPFAREAIGAEPPRRGDVVLFRSVEGDEEEVPGEVVKRVIGLPGDHVAMVNGHPVINGEEVPSCAAGTFIYFTAGQVAHGRLEVELLDGTKYLVVREIMPIPFAGYDVRPGEVFVLGDNRGSSNDSRSWRARYGAGVPFTSIDGRLERILVGTRRDGHLDLDRLGKRLGVDLHLPGVDASALEAGIRRCLENVDRGGR